VVGEGGNLGMTQLARVEYCLNGGHCFTDSIDNAGGVNCSDAEVNIKILLNQLVEQGKTTMAKRNRFLESMTDEVAELVLDNNYGQAQAINLMEFQAGRRNYEYARMMHVLEERGGLDATLEFLPTDEQLQERRATNQSFTGPEISVITSYTKAMLKQELAASDLLDEPYLTKEIRRAFPPTMLKRYGRELENHRLRREIIATQIANGMVNRMGINFVTRMTESAGVDHDQIAKAYIAARDIFEIEELWDEIQAEDYKVDPVVQKEMMIVLIRLVRRTARWLLRNRRHSLSLDDEVPQFHRTMRTLFSRWDTILCGDALADWNERRSALLEAGVREYLAGYVAGAHHIYATMGVVEASNRTGETPVRVASVYYAVGERLGLHWFSREIHEYQAGTHWQALARETLQDDLNWQQVAITLGVIAEGAKRKHVDTLIDNWMERHEILVKRWMSLQAEMRAAPTREPAVFTVAIRELLDLAQASSGARARFP
jgi:glutamate dehydrogenase